MQNIYIKMTGLNIHKSALIQVKISQIFTVKITNNLNSVAFSLYNYNLVIFWVSSRILVVFCHGGPNTLL